MAKQVALKDVAIFAHLSRQSLAEVEAALQPRRLAAGEILFNQGDPGDELIVVAEGGVAIFVPVADTPGGGQPIRIFHPGEVLGEMALIDQKPRSVSARADGETLILTLNGENFRRILGQNPDLALAVMSSLSDRIRYTTDFLGEVRGWVRRMAEGNYQVSDPAEGGGYQDKTLASLAAEFAQMAAQVQQREETLRKEVAQLRIEIDEVKRRQEAERIMGSEYYRNLKERARVLREQSK